MARDPRRFDDLFAEFGRIEVRRMFGGEGIFADKIMFGLVSDERVYLKTDEETRKAYLAEGMKPFTYTKTSTGETMEISYYAVPDRLYDDPEEFAQWAHAALRVAERSPTALKKRRSKPKRGVLG
jgi:DNA transformation protein